MPKWDLNAKQHERWNILRQKEQFDTTHFLETKLTCIRPTILPKHLLLKERQFVTDVVLTRCRLYDSWKRKKRVAK